MPTILTTDGLPPRAAFAKWRDFISDQYGVLKSSWSGVGPFRGSIELCRVGHLRMMHTRSTNWRIETDLGARHLPDPDNVSIVFQLRGFSHTRQHDRAISVGDGSLFIMDRTPVIHAGGADAHSRTISLNRTYLEKLLGPARTFAALDITPDIPSASLARVFFDELARVGENLSEDAADRMSAIGVDLIVAAVAERMARETPRPLQGTVTVQRAKAYVEQHLSDPALDPPQLAAAVGVSLRRLQELFHERGRHVSDWIWQRRLEMAAQRLADPGYAHLPIATLAYGCGFLNQSHFSKRFRDRFGVSPREHRQSSLMRESDGA